MKNSDFSNDYILLDIRNTESQVLIAAATAGAGCLSASDETGKGNESVKPQDGL
jgi:hypothetical protein